jgi:type IV secretion system protein VirB8
MNDIGHTFGALPILDPERIQYHKAVRSFQAHKVDDSNRRRRIWFCIAITGWMMTGVLATGISAALPLKSVVPFFIAIHDDGTTDTAISLSDLGPTMTDKIVRASVWRYVEMRESYTYSDARYRYDFVSLISGADVQRNYQQWFLKSPDSPQKTIGKNGQIWVKEIAMTQVRDSVVEVRFWRFKQLNGAKEDKISATATVEYQYLGQAAKELVLAGDPAALQIVRYSVEDNTP